MRCLSLLLAAALLLPHGAAWAGLCSMSESSEEAAHACLRGGECPHHAHRPAAPSAPPDCHSKEPVRKPAAFELTCGCGAGHGNASVAATVFDRLGPLPDSKDLFPALAGEPLILRGPAVPSDPLLELPVPPPRAAI